MKNMGVNLLPSPTNANLPPSPKGRGVLSFSLWEKGAALRIADEGFLRFKILVIIWLLFLGHSALAVNGVTFDPSRTLYSARQLGMGGVSINFSNDANGVFSNPAGLTGLEFPQLTSSSRNIMLDETQYIMLGWAVPTDWGTFGLGYAGMGTGGSLPTYLDPATGRILQNPSLEAGSYANSVVAFSFTREIKTPLKIAVGGNFKLYSQALSGGGFADRGTGTGLDLGAIYRPLPWLSTGAVLQNIVGGSVKWNSTEDKLGGYYKIGVAANILGASGEALRAFPQPLRAGIDLELPSNVLAASSSLLYHLGLEYLPAKNIFLRAGLNQETAGSGFTLGIGMVNGGFRYDYAYVQRAGLPGDNPHYFSLSYVGERVLTIDRQSKQRSAHLKFLAPRDRLITDQEFIALTAEAWAEKSLDQKKTWTVTAVSATHEAQKISETEKLAQVFLNGKAIDQTGTFETLEKVEIGRNVFRLVGYVSAKAKIAGVHGSAEVRVLRVLPFTDVSMDSWTVEPVYTTVVMGLVKGYPDNSFKPAKGITRAELVALLVRSLGIPQETLDTMVTGETSFSDVPSSNWAAKYIAHGVRVGFVTGYPDGTFKPEKVLNRAEAITILARYAGLPEETSIVTAPFTDLKTDFWANKFIVPAVKAGLLKYLEGKDFESAKDFSRAEACEVLYRVPAIQKETEQFWNTGIISPTQ